MKLLLLAAALALVVPSARAATAYSLADCYRLAVERSETLAEDAETIRQAEESIRQTKAAFLPSATLGATWTRQEESSNPLGQSLLPSSQRTAQVTATQSLFRGFQDLAALRRSRSLKEASVQAWRQAYLQIYLDVADAYYTVLKDEHDLRNYAGELEADRRRHDQLASMRRFGRAREADVVSLQAAIAGVEASLAATRGALGADRETLAFLTGREPEIALVDVDTAAAPPATLADAQARIDARPDVAQAKSRLAASEAALTAAQGAHLPSVDLTGDYYLDRSGAYSGVHWDGQLSVSVPLFSGGATRSKVRAARSSRTAERLSYELARRQASEAIRSAYKTVTEELAQADKLAQATRMYDRYYALLLKDNQSGIATNVDVLLALATAEQTRRSSDRARLNSHYDLVRLQVASADDEILKQVPGDPHAPTR